MGQVSQRVCDNCERKLKPEDKVYRVAYMDQAGTEIILDTQEFDKLSCLRKHTVAIGKKDDDTEFVKDIDISDILSMSLASGEDASEK